MYTYVLVPLQLKPKQSAMGKGDLKTKRGKIHRGTYGKRRPSKKKKNTQNPARPAQASA
ncbi:ribosomal small subunit protein bTHX [Schleiferia thermophila]|jgi:30S ribosomal protein S31|uniref:Ribosomal small subunit protein bTHX n=1 Tax=Schleiferia thermophila TaxID=884107 RepID=A0A368ZYC8_9FLAO|nr:ribosomal small subunit protein bTHX [Schleiferia thermophila]